MATVDAKIDFSQVKAKLTALAKIRNQAMPKIYDEFVKNTPVKTGSARSNTTYHSDIITANYPYADVLDAGRGFRDGQMRGSNQAPYGMTKPTEDYAKKLIPQLAKNIGAKK